MLKKYKLKERYINEGKLAKMQIGTMPQMNCLTTLQNSEFNFLINLKTYMSVFHTTCDPVSRIAWVKEQSFRAACHIYNQYHVRWGDLACKCMVTNL